MTGPKLVYVLGYVVVVGNYDDGISSFGSLHEGRAAAQRECEEAKRQGFEDADVFMLIPPDAIPMWGDR